MDAELQLLSTFIVLLTALYAVISWRLRVVGYRWPVKSVNRIAFGVLLLIAVAWPMIASPPLMPDEATLPGEGFAMLMLLQITMLIWVPYALLRIVWVTVAAWQNRQSP